MGHYQSLSSLGTDPEHLMGGLWYNFFFFFDINHGINLKYIKVMYKNKISLNLILAKR
jgi:hypothetical protein